MSYDYCKSKKRNRKDTSFIIEATKIGRVRRGRRILQNKGGKSGHMVLDSTLFNESYIRVSRKVTNGK